MTYTLLGRKKVTTKTGRAWNTYFFSCDFSDYEKENSEECLGLSVLIEGSLACEYLRWRLVVKGTGKKAIIP